MSDNGINFGEKAQFSLNGKTLKRKSDYGNYSMTLPDSFQHKSVRLDHPRNGLSIFSSSFCFSHDKAVPYEVDGGAFTISLILSGLYEDASLDYKTDKPCDMMYVPHNFEGEALFRGGQFYQSVGVCMDQNCILDMIQGEDRFAPLEQQFHNRDEFHMLGVFAQSPVTKLIAKQILECPLDGSCRRLFLEGKSLELIGFMLQRLTDDEIRATVSLSRDDVERIREARRLLLSDMVNPPTIKELARLSGINEFKLKKGFREVFGHTIYQCLRAHRMESARELLENTDTTVGLAASMVGYTNMSHFSTAFRKHFGINPGSILYHNRRKYRGS